MPFWKYTPIHKDDPKLSREIDIWGVVFRAGVITEAPDSMTPKLGALGYLRKINSDMPANKAAEPKKKRGRPRKKAVING